MLRFLTSVTGQLGPPITCPLPEGAGFRMIHKDVNGKVVFCNRYLNNNSTGCPFTHECIKSIGTFSDKWNGVCCPKKGRIKINKYFIELIFRTYL